MDQSALLCVVLLDELHSIYALKHGGDSSGVQPTAGRGTAL